MRQTDGRFIFADILYHTQKPNAISKPEFFLQKRQKNDRICTVNGMIELKNVRIGVADDANSIKKTAAKKLNIPASEIEEVVFLKKSVDARKKTDVFYACTLGVKVKLNENAVIKKAKDACIYLPAPEYRQLKATKMPKNGIAVLGAGPAGLFAALTLARAGLNPVLFERGADADERVKRIEGFFKNGVLDGKSNVQFGEGGAGTFSDGKLTTNIKDPRCRHVLETFASFGAPEEILYQSKPHLGTDKLRNIVKNIRNEIISLGGSVHFLSQITDIETASGAVCGIQVNAGEIYRTDKLIIAAGHSARDVFEMLKKHGVKMERKPFSVGVRIEHKQEDINKSQYGAFYKYLPPADYKLSCHLPSGRGVYTFCMCPGGQVVAAASEEGYLVVNGMSNFARDGENANSALLCDVTPDDFPSDDILAGVDFQQEYEKKAFIAGGSNYRAPAQKLGDFLSGKASECGGRIKPSYPLGVTWCSLKDVLPDFCFKSLKEAIPIFDGKLHGFAEPDAVLTGIETRSSSPVRILRDETLQSSIKGIYPCGEGAGYAGGIMSAAVDGIRVAEKIAEEFI